MVKKKEIKAVLFDLDGSLINSELALYYLFRATLREFKENQKTKKEIMKPIGSPSRVWLKTLAPKVSPAKLEQMRRWFGDRYARHYMLRFATPIRYSTEILKELRKNKIKLGIVSNQTMRQAKISMKVIKFNKFNVVSTADKVKKSKPAPDSLNYALKKLKVKNNEVIFIGDTISDYKAGKAAGVKTYLLEHRYNRNIPAKKIKTLKQVLKLVL